MPADQERGGATATLMPTRKLISAIADGEFRQRHVGRLEDEPLT
jgi:hypothetical protein